jgi:hypothetical protein
MKRINKFKPLYCMGHTQLWESSSLTAIGGLISLCRVEIKQRKRLIDSHDIRTFKHEPSAFLSTWPLIPRSLRSSVPCDHARLDSWLRLLPVTDRHLAEMWEGCTYAAWKVYAVLSYAFLAWTAWSQRLPVSIFCTPSKYIPYCLITQVSSPIKVR